MQYVAVCCCALQYVAACCCALQYVRCCSVRCNMLQCAFIADTPHKIKLEFHPATATFTLRRHRTTPHHTEPHRTTPHQLSEWKDSCLYDNGLDQSNPRVVWFWEAVAAMSPGARADVWRYAMGRNHPWRGVVQCVAVWCGVLRCIAVCCSVLRCVV